MSLAEDLRALAQMKGLSLNPNKGWTDERIALLTKLWTEGLSASQIARELRGGISRSAVIGKVHRLGLARRATRTGASKSRKGLSQIRRAPAVPSKPRLIPAPAHKPRAPLRGPSSVLFIDREPNQCPMFCAGEEGPEGFVCGEASALGSWCENCARLVWLPAEKRRAA